MVSVVVALRVSCPVACGILVHRPGIEPTAPALAGRFLAIGPPGTSLNKDLIDIRVAGFREQRREKALRWENILHVFRKEAQKCGGVTEGADGLWGRRSCEELVFYAKCNMKPLESADKNFTHCFKKSQGSDTMKSIYHPRYMVLSA